MTRRALLFCAAALAACVPHLAERQVPVLEGEVLRDYTIRHAEAGDCVMRHLLPVSYEVKRPRYALRIKPHAGYAGEPLSMQLVLEAPGAILIAEGAQLKDEGEVQPGVRRYRLTADPQLAGTLRLEIWRGDQKIGVEWYTLTAERCRALLLSRG